MSKLDAFLQAIITPFLFLHLFGAFISIVWLAILGKWTVILFGLLYVVIVSVLIRIVLFPAGIFMLIGSYFDNRGKKGITGVFVFLHTFYTYSIVLVSMLLVAFFYSLAIASGSGVVPFSIGAFSIAIGPWFKLAAQKPECYTESMLLFLADISFFIALMLISIFKVDLLIAFIPVFVAFLIGILLTTLFYFQLKAAEDMYRSR
jgi:hypothetical protein